MKFDSFTVGFFILVGLMFDGCMISSAIHDVALQISNIHCGCK